MEFNCNLPFSPIFNPIIFYSVTSLLMNISANVFDIYLYIRVSPYKIYCGMCVCIHMLINLILHMRNMKFLCMYLDGGDTKQVDIQAFNSER